MAQLALPALIRMAPQTPFEARILARASFTGAACTLFVREHSRGRGGHAGNNQSKVILFLLADAGVGGGVFVSQW